MSASRRVSTALAAMKNIGFQSEEAAQVLKKLLKVYNNCWVYIEENGYQLLVDSILEELERKASDDAKNKKKQPLKLDPVSSGETSLTKKPKLEAADSSGKLIYFKDPKIKPEILGVQKNSVEVDKNLSSRNLRMLPPPRARDALVAMKEIGFSSKEAAPVLKKLIEVYDNNWEYIEENHYQVLVDSILEEAQETKDAGDGKPYATCGAKLDAAGGDASVHQRKRTMLDSDGPGEILFKKPEEGAESPAGAHDVHIRADPKPLQVVDRGKNLSLEADDNGKTYLNLPPINNGETMSTTHASKASFAQETAQATLLTYSRLNYKVPAGKRNPIYHKEPKIKSDTGMQNTSKAASPASSKEKEAAKNMPAFKVPIVRDEGMS